MGKPERAQPRETVYATEDAYRAALSSMEADHWTPVAQRWEKPSSGMVRKLAATATLGVSSLVVRKRPVLVVTWIDPRIPPDLMARLHPQAFDDLRFELLPTETVTIVIPGLWDSAIIATDARRVFVFKKGLMGGVIGGARLASWSAATITGVQMELGRATGYVALQTPNAPVADLSYWATDATSPASAPNAIAISRNDAEAVRAGVRDLRQMLLAGA